MIKRIISILMFALLFVQSGSAIISAAPKAVFKKNMAYKPFSDVDESAWYYENVKAVCEYGLMNGKSTEIFDPDGEMTIAEALTLICRVHNLFFHNKYEFTASGPWYQTYIDYTQEYGLYYSIYFIIDGVRFGLPWAEDFNVPVTRGTFAHMISLSVSGAYLNPINADISADMIPDVSRYYRYTEEISEAVLLLYRAGVMTGVDGDGAFHQDDTLKRSEAAAILTRVVDPSLRKTVTLKAPEPAPPNEDSIRRFIAKYGGGEVVFLSLADFDMDGTEEAFFVTESKDSSGRRTRTYVWYSALGHTDLICAFDGTLEAREYSDPYDDFGNFKVFRIVGYYMVFSAGDGFDYRMWRVRNGSLESFELPNYIVQYDPIKPKAEPYRMYSEGSSPSVSLAYSPEYKAYIIASTQYIMSLDDEAPEGWVEAECLLEYSEEEGDFLWTKRRLDSYEQFDVSFLGKDHIDPDEWIPSPKEKTRIGRWG